MTTKTPDTLPWVEKYRPASLSDLISHQDILSTIGRLIDSNRLPHLLLHGPPGTGKTSTILAMARSLFGKSFQSNILELNASDERGIDVVRNQIMEFASTRTIFSSSFKLIILDEADAMTSTAQMALRRVIEKYTKNARFCLICNYVSRIIPALQSRCTVFRFGPLQTDQIRPRLESIAQAESVTFTPDGLDAIIDLASGDMRKCLNVLQATHMAHGTITLQNVYACTGNPQPEDVQLMLNWMLNLSLPEALACVSEMKKEKGLALADIVREVHAICCQMKLPTPVLAQLLVDLGDVEYRLMGGGSEKLQLGALIASFQHVRYACP
eukprot:c26626_g1_i1.p1 GENE.c26626_g1_i1~~c26626_g1_i1.p1  ORF type:complete len:341 (-),score=74.54 c26626_g1_i1:13-990(-)